MIRGLGVLSASSIFLVFPRPALCLMQARPALRTAVGAPGPVLRGLFRVAEAQSSRGGAEAATPLAAERNTLFQRAQHSVFEAALKNPFAAPLRSPVSDPKQGGRRSIRRSLVDSTRGRTPSCCGQTASSLWQHRTWKRAFSQAAVFRPRNAVIQSTVSLVPGCVSGWLKHTPLP